MNKFSIFSTFTILTLVAATGLVAAAPDKGNVESYRGEGTLFSDKRQVIGKYSLELTRAKAAQNVIQQKVVVKLPDGRTETRECRIFQADGAESWRSECEGGTGGGHCFGDGLCIDYLSMEGGRSFATTIAMNDDGSMRLLRTELVDGKAVRFYRESLTPVR